MDAARGHPLRTTSTGRTRAEQWQAWRKYLNGGSLAAYPGTSPHEFGNASDFHNSEWEWLLEHGNNHGWYLTISSEPWHRVYYPARDKYHGNNPAGTESFTGGFLMSLDTKQQEDIYMRVEAIAQTVARLERIVTELFVRVRGEDPDVDMMQDILGQLTEVRKAHE